MDERKIRMLVTGGDGQLGRDLVAAAARAGIECIGLGRAELDITDAQQVQQVLADVRPTHIAHCAAWTAVDDAENHEDAATLVNGTGTANIAAAAAQIGAHTAYVSTDYVFDGSNPDGYAENDAPAPINAYGRSKLAGEAAVLAYDNTAVVRTAWVFGEHGENFVRTMDRLTRERDEVAVVTDQVGSPTWTGHLATALLDVAERNLTGILHVAGEPTATWHEVAAAVAAENGSQCTINETTSDAFPRPAARPACSILRSTRPDAPAGGDWREGVRRTIRAAATR